MHSFAEVKHFIDQVIIRKRGVPCCDTIVMKDHKQLFRYTTGIASKANNTPLQPHALFHMYSCTKPMTAAAGLRLVEEGKLELDAPVSTYLPAFAQLHLLENGIRIRPKTEMTVRHLFTMSGGFDYTLFTDPSILRLLAENPEAGTTEIVSAFAKRSLLFHPGTQFNYSICHDILAGVIEVCAGMPLGDFLNQWMFKPLRMCDSHFHYRPEDKNRMVDQYQSEQGNIYSIGNEKTEFVPTAHYDSGGAGLITSADDYAIFADTMACGGTTANGYRLLNSESIRLLATPHMDMNMDGNDDLSVTRQGYRYGLGVRTRVQTTQASSPIGEFGWDGAAGSYVLMDPVNHISIFFAMHVRNWPDCIGYDHNILRDLVYKAIASE